jgi:hypothetical protein
MLHPWESFFNQPEASFLPLANMSMTKSSKSPVSFSRQDQGMAGASAGASALGAGPFRGSLHRWLFRGNDRDLYLCCARYFQ